VDAHLTKIGIGQAKAAHAFWNKQLEVQKMPAPETYYVSPLDRCLNTANITFGQLKLPADRPFVPTVKEVSGRLFFFFCHS
jgi:broad specificity phosphatase PhoE